MKKFIFTILVGTLAISWSHAQEKNNIRLGMDLGYTVPDGGGGILLALEPKYNLADNMNVGFRIEGAVMAKNITATNVNAEIEADLSANITYYGTFDYYFNNGNSSFAPFLGVGLGYSSLANLEVGLTEDISEIVEVDGKYGGLIRAGFELGKSRLSAAYNIIGNTEVGEGPDAAEINNSYIGITLGFYFGGGKWKK